MNEPHTPLPSSPPGSPVSPHANKSQLIPVAIVWAVVLAVAGGFLTGMLIHKFQMLGALGLWGVGALGGFVSRKITRAPCPIAGYCLAGACFIAFALAEASWYHWTYTIPDPVTGEQRESSWSEAFQRTPKFMWQHAPFGLAVGALCAGFGAHSAFVQAGSRYRLIAVAEDS